MHGSAKLWPKFVLRGVRIERAAMTAAVFDCMIYLQAATNNQGPAFACLELAELGKVQLYVSPPILREVRSVLTRRSIRDKFPNLIPDLVDVFVQKLASVAVLMAEVPSAGVGLRDQNDLAYLDLAIAVNATYLVTRDKDLLDLMSQASFVKTYGNLHIVEPVEFLESVRSS